jgi:predicted glycoside hydrolase/deacetylase ChbG (UPF0249 family)
LSQGSKLLIVNADDFGFTRDVNEGIVEAHRKGILTATTLMANGCEFDHAVKLARQNPSLDIGCHLVLVGGERYPRTVKDLIVALARRALDVEKELDWQVRRIIEAGLKPSHLDTHKHTHLLPPVLGAVCRIAQRYGISWIRRPFDYPMNAGSVPLSRKLLTNSLGFMRPWFHNALKCYGCSTTDHFAGFRVTGFFHTSELVELLEQLPTGSTEFMTHPGFCTAELREATTRLKESRQKELEALCAPETRATIERLGIRLGSYQNL